MPQAQPNDWRTVQPNDWQTVPAKGSTAQPNDWQTVQLPNGQTAQFPGGMSPEDMQSAIEALPQFAPPPSTGARAMSFLKDLGHRAQGEIDDLTRIKPFDPVHPIDTTLGNVGAGLMSPLSLLAHPKASAEAMRPHGTAETLVNLLGPEALPALHMGEQLVHNPAGTAEQGLGMIAGAGLSDLVPEAGGPLKSAGSNIMNRTIGTIASDMKRGANPGAAYFEGGGTPSFTMGGLARKGAAVQSRAGQTLGDLYDAASKPGGPKIASADAAGRLLDPINKLRDLQEGPGGVGASPMLDAYTERLAPALLDAKDAGGFTPRGLFDLKRSVAGNTRWNDPTMLDLNAARQEGVGGLGDLLTDVVPEAKPQNKIYQGALKLRTGPRNARILRTDAVNSDREARVGNRRRSGHGIHNAQSSAGLAATHRRYASCQIDDCMDFFRAVERSMRFLGPARWLSARGPQGG